MPQRLRVDNGWPWGAQRDLPPVLSLWLWGLGCGLIWNRPRRPQENGVVERFHGLLDSWGEPERCADWQEWTQRLAWVVKVQREQYPAIAGKSRLAAYPALEHNPRRYAGGADEDWQLARVHHQLARARWRRQVDKVGRITLYHRPYGVGRALAGREVWVRLDAERQHWVIEDERGREVARYPAAELTRARILALDISHVKPHERRDRRQNLPAFYVT